MNFEKNDYRLKVKQLKDLTKTKKGYIILSNIAMKIIQRLYYVIFNALSYLIEL